MGSIESFLTQTEFFKDLEIGEAIDILKIAKKTKLPKGMNIISEGEDGECFYLISEGRVSVCMNNSNNPDEEVTLSTLDSGQVFGEMILIGKKRRQASVKTHSAVELLEWEQSDIEDLFSEKPVIAYKVMKNLAKIMSDRIMDMNLKLRNQSDGVFLKSEHNFLVI